MDGSLKWSRGLIIAGFLLMIVGAVDPLEGSVVIVAGSAIAAVGGWIGPRQFRKLLLWSFTLVLVGVAAMWGLSAIGGVGGSTGRPYWWAAIILPYPVGWMLGLVGSFRALQKTATSIAP